jgi:hypothetical protein
VKDAIHEYTPVDVAKMHQYCQSWLMDFTEFIAPSKEYIERKR